MPIVVAKLENARPFIANLRVVSETLVRGGQPEPEGLRLLKEAGVRTIINLRSSDSGLASFFRRSANAAPASDPELEQERQTARQLGLRFVQIPLDVFGNPEEQHFEQFLALVSSPQDDPTFVHCLHGRDRTGLMLGVYRIAVHGWTAQKAYAEMIQCGFDRDRTNLSNAMFAYAKKCAP